MDDTAVAKAEDVAPMPSGLRVACIEHGLRRPQWVARGGAGQIYRAIMLDAHQQQQEVAIKCLGPKLEQSRSAGHMLRHEAGLLATMRHPGIVPCLAAAPPTSPPYLITAFIDGLSLAQVIVRMRARRIALPVTLAVAWLCQLLDALAYAHHPGARLVHRDVTPQNVMVTRKGAVTLLDWGCAHRIGKLSANEQGIVVGKPGYAPPELEDRGDCSAADDVFSVAVVLWELLAFKRLFAAAGFMATRRRVRQLLNTEVGSPRRRLPDSLNRLLMRALHPEASRRFTCAYAFKEALKRALPASEVSMKQNASFDQVWSP